MGNQNDPFETLRLRLNPFSYSVRAAQVTNLYYVTAADSHTFALRYGPDGWICNPITSTHDVDRAADILEIATGQRRQIRD